MVEGMEEAGEPMSKSLKTLVQVVNFAMLAVGGTGGPLLLRLYYLHGGALHWLPSWIQTAGWPVIFLPLSISYIYRRRRRRAEVFLITAPLCFAAAAVGLLTGLSAFLFAYGVSYVPASTVTILTSTQLGFTALFAFLLVRHRFTRWSLGAVVLLTVGAAVLGLNASGDRPAGESRWQYYVGFFVTLAGTAVTGFQLPVVELMYGWAARASTYTLVCEVQVVMSVFATLFSTAGMLLNHELHSVPREAMEFDLGEFNYYVLLVCSAIVWQFFYLGIVGAIFYTSALLAGIIQTILLPVTDILAVVFLRERFTGGKGAALALTLCGFASYFYGDYKVNKKQRSLEECELLQDSDYCVGGGACNA